MTKEQIKTAKTIACNIGKIVEYGLYTHIILTSIRSFYVKYKAMVRGDLAAFNEMLGGRGLQHNVSGMPNNMLHNIATNNMKNAAPKLPGGVIKTYRAAFLGGKK